jgi:hypothetical protein
MLSNNPTMIVASKSTFGKSCIGCNAAFLPHPLFKYKFPKPETDPGAAYHSCMTSSYSTATRARMSPPSTRHGPSRKFANSWTNA